MIVNQWYDIEDKVPANGENVIIDWTDNKTGEAYFSDAVWNTEIGGWVINSPNSNNFTVHRWRRKG